MDDVHALRIICRLANAVAAEVFVYDHRWTVLKPIIGSFEDPYDSAAGSLVDLRQVETFARNGETGPIWADEGGKSSRAACLIKLCERDSRTFLVSLFFASDTAIVRARIGRIAGDVAALIRFHIERESRRIEQEEAGGAAMAALDHSDYGVIAVRANGSIIFQNAIAESYLAQKLGLAIRRERLVAAADRRFEPALQRILDMPDAPALKRQRAAVMLIKREDDARSIAVVITPCEVLSADVPHRSPVAALIYMLDPSQTELPGLKALCQLHGLSGAEGRLLVNLTRGLTLADAATEMQLKLETARGYLKQIFAKTGARRQADLVALMTRYLQAFRGDFDFEPV